MGAQESGVDVRIEVHSQRVKYVGFDGDETGHRAASLAVPLFLQSADMGDCLC